jgi:hypothetical protein
MEMLGWTYFALTRSKQEYLLPWKDAVDRMIIYASRNENWKFVPKPSQDMIIEAQKEQEKY